MSTLLEGILPDDWKLSAPSTIHKKPVGLEIFVNLNADTNAAVETHYLLALHIVVLPK